MGTTPIFGFPYPDPSDLVANYPALGQQLAEDVEDAIYARKFLQIVRATDVTSRSTTSTAFVDITGLSVTITPSSATSTVLIWALFGLETNSTTAGSHVSIMQITDASNVAVSGAEGQVNGNVNYSFSGTAIFTSGITLLARATPATTSAVTYKARFRSEVATTTTIARNNLTTGQIYAIEVSA